MTLIEGQGHSVHYNFQEMVKIIMVTDILDIINWIGMILG